MAYRARSVPRSVLHIWAVECFRHVPDMVRRTPTTRLASIYNSVDRVTAAVDLLFLCEDIIAHSRRATYTEVKGGFIGRWFDAYGPRVIMIPGTLILVFSIMMTSLATQYYQYILAQGILFGLGVGMMCAPPHIARRTPVDAT